MLRVRRDNGHFIQTVKSAGAPRQHAACPRRVGRRDRRRTARPGAGASGRFLTADIADRVAPVFRTEVTRLVTDLSPAPGTRIEAAIDRGTIRAPGRKPRERISEIELELKSGPVTALYDVALRLLAEAPVRLEWRSKAERGYRLAAGYPISPSSRADPFALDPGLSAEEALQRIGRVCLDQILRNEAAIFAGRADGHPLADARRGSPPARGPVRVPQDAASSPSSAAGPAANCAGLPAHSARRAISMSSMMPSSDRRARPFPTSRRCAC